METTLSSLPSLGDLAGQSSFAVLCAAFILGCGGAAILLLRRDAPVRLAGRIAMFAAFTLLLLGHGVTPYEPNLSALRPAQRLGVYVVSALWWVSLARCVTGAAEVFVIFERKPRESRLFRQLIGVLVYLCVVVAILGQLFEVPVGAVFATSGAVAIILGLALQSTLSDVFSGVAIGLGGAYRIGDWIALDNGVEGKVVETNWQNVHLLTGTHDLAIVPNSVMAKARIVNQSWPESARDAKLVARLRPTLPPDDVVDMARDALASCNLILHDPAPGVVIRSLSATAIELELKGRAPDRTQVDAARNEMFDHLYRHVAAAGLRFAPEAGDAAPPHEADVAVDAARRLAGNLPLFASLALEDRAALAAKMRRREYAPGDEVIGRGVVADALGVVLTGAVAVIEGRDGREHELVRLGSGDYFGEDGLLLGEPQHGALRAVTRAIVYEIGAEDLAPILRERPELSRVLGEALARHRAMRQNDESAAARRRSEHSARRFSDRIRQLFALDLTDAR
ncbi:mechanosensitive ion channel family protein [Methylocella sp.]|uniref:mechanosensitive ion channel family protein n=1 Tax=Methylocella sp. TaxID=1978226 RepID=UPI0037838D11